MKEQRKTAKDGRNSTDPMKEMRERYERAVEADRQNRDLAIDDLKFVTVPGWQWDESQKKARKGRPCYEFPLLRSLWRQVVNDQKKARPGIKVRAVEDGDAKGAELRQGLIRNIESTSNAERAYDVGFELFTAAGMGAWRVVTEYSEDDGWEQDIRIRPIHDPLNSVWFDPDSKDPNARDAMFAFVEESISHDEFKRRWPKADLVDFETARAQSLNEWFCKDTVRICEYWRKVQVTKTLLLLADGRTVDAAEVPPDALMALDVVNKRVCKTWKVVSSICSGKEELEGPFDSVFNRIPIVPIYANRYYIDGRWQWSGLVRAARDAQKLANYNLTAGQEILAKQHKAVPLVTPTMLDGEGVKALWDKSNAVDVPYLPFTPDPKQPQGPSYLTPPQAQIAFVQAGQMSMDLIKSATGIYDASIGARSNETSGKAILARQQEGDTATYDYQDALAFGIQATGELILSALPKVYDTPRMMRVLGKDGAEDVVQLYQELPNGTVMNDLSAGKYDTTVTTGPSYDTQRMEFVDAMVQLAQGNPLIAQGCPDLIIGSMDFPKADEAAERIKLLLPPPIQQSLAQGKDISPESQQAMQQAQQMMQAAQQQMAMLQQAMAELEQEKAQVGADKAAIDAKAKEIAADIKVAQAQMRQAEAEFRAEVAEYRAANPLRPQQDDHGEPIAAQ